MKNFLAILLSLTIFSYSLHAWHKTPILKTPLSRQIMLSCKRVFFKNFDRGAKITLDSIKRSLAQFQEMHDFLKTNQHLTDNDRTNWHNHYKSTLENLKRENEELKRALTNIVEFGFSKDKATQYTDKATDFAMQIQRLSLT